MWLILTGCGTAALLAPHVVPAWGIKQLASYCRSPHDDCALCGMTRGFVLIADGELEAGVSINRGAVPLYFLLLANASLALWYACRSAFKGIRRRLKVVEHGRWAAKCKAKEQTCKS